MSDILNRNLDDLEQAWVLLSNQFANTFATENQPFYLGRDSVRYRAWSLTWHIQTLQRRYSDMHKYANRDVPTALKIWDDHSFALKIGHEFSYLFDDVIFNSLSLLDYTAALLCHMIDLKVKKPMWSEIAVRAKAAELPEALANIICEEDDLWVGGLRWFRNRLIHSELQSGEAHQGLNLNNLNNPDKASVATFTFFLPEQLTQRIAKILPACNKVALIEGATIVATRCIQLSAAVLRGAEPFMIKDRGVHKPPPGRKYVKLKPPPTTDERPRKIVMNKPPSPEKSD